jgi:iron complex outermembrane receptor protein
MRASRLTALIISTAFLIIGGVCSFAADQSPSTKTPPDHKIGTKEELSMFFEEKDLVTANKRATPEREAPAIATVVTAEEIRNMGARNLLDVLKMVQGFGVAIQEFGTYMVEVRGVRTTMSEKVLLMIDGHAINKNTNGSAWIYNFGSMLPVENIKQVEIIRGPGSALYGSNAFLASVNIITRDAGEIDGLEVKAGGGNFNAYKGNITGGKAINDKLNVSGSVDYYNTQGAKLRINADALTPSGTSLAPANADLRYKQLDAFLKLVYGDFSFRGQFSNLKNRVYIGLAQALTEDSYGDSYNAWGELAYAVRLSDTLSSNLKIRYDHYSQDPYAKLFPNGAQPFFPAPIIFPDGMIAKPLVKNGTFGTELQFDWDVSKNNHLIFGMAYEMMRQYDTKQFANYDPLTFLPLPTIEERVNWNRNVTRHIFAAYLQDEWKLLDRLNLTGGVRYDRYSDFGDTVNPRAGLVWNFIDNGNLKLLYGQAFRAPNFVELYNINNPVVVGNPSLKPEKVKTYEAALTYRFARWLAVDINYFYSNIDNLISWDGSTSPASYSNTGKANVQGIETALRGSPLTGLRYKLAYTWQDPRDGITHGRLPYVPSHRATGSINYALNKYINLHTDLLWTGPQPRAQGETRVEMPAYFTADLAVTFRNFIKNLEVQAAVHNLFDKKYSDPDTSGIANKVPRDFPREGISGFLTVTYKF